MKHVTFFNLPGISVGDEYALESFARAWIKLFPVSDDTEYYRKFVDNREAYNTFDMVDEELAPEQIEEVLDMSRLGEDLIHHNQHVRVYAENDCSDVMVEFVNPLFDAESKVNEVFSAFKEAERLLGDGE